MIPYMKYLEGKCVMTERMLTVATSRGVGRKWGVIANVYRIPFLE